MKITARLFEALLQTEKQQERRSKILKINLSISCCVAKLL
jgi:hypothetical protein